MCVRCVVAAGAVWVSAVGVVAGVVGAADDEEEGKEDEEED